MRFYKFSKPKYSSDHEDKAMNPVMLVAGFCLPGIVCPECGPWASSSRLSTASTQIIESSHCGEFVSPDEWQAIRAHWAERLGIREEDVEPGATIGRPCGLLWGDISNDIIYPRPGVIWVSEVIVKMLSPLGLKGFSFAEVSFDENGWQPNTALYEVVVSGRARRHGVDESALLACTICQRRIFPNPKQLNIEESSWDGSDFVILDWNPNIIIVTQTVKDVFGENSIDNIEFIPIE